MCSIYTEKQLKNLKVNELRALFRKVSQELISSDPGTRKRRSALASLDNIERTMNTKLAAPRLKPPGF